MGVLLLPRRYSQQPQQQPRLDPDHTIGRDVVFDAWGPGGMFDVAGGVTPTALIGAITPAHHPIGVGAAFSSAVLSYGDRELFTGAQATFMVIDQPNSVAVAGGLINKRSTHATQNSFSFGYNYNGGDEFTVDIGNSSGTGVLVNYQFHRSEMVATRPQVKIITIDGQAAANNKVKLWLDGKPVTLKTINAESAFSNFPNTSANIELGRLNSSTSYYAGRLFMARAINRTLSEQEVIALFENPNCIYSAPPRRLWAGVSGGASNTPVDPAVGALALTGYAPTIDRTAHQAIAPSVGSLSVTGYAPTVAQSSGTDVLPSAGTLAITGYAPSVAQSANQSAEPGAGSLALTGYAPSVAQSANQDVTPSASSMAITGYAPTVTQASASVALTPSVGTLTIIGYEPTIRQTGNEGHGFVMVDIEPTWKRALRLRAEKSAKVDLDRKKRKRAELIERLAAKEALSDRSEPQIQARIKSLLGEWVDLAPKLDTTPVAELPQGEAYRAFMDRVARHIQRIEDEDDEHAAEMLLLL